VTAFYGPELVGPSCTEHCASIYRAMLAAAPAVQPAPVPPSQTPDVHLAGSQECAPAAREADSRSLADGDYARIAEACGANVRWHGGGLSFLASDWGRFCDRLRAAPSGVPQDSAPLPLSVSSGRSAADTPLRSQPQSGDEVRE
jgi:hypothetical protein